MKTNQERQKEAKDTFALKAQKIHGNKYDYSKVNYVNAKTKVCIICPIHGEFWQTPNGHLSGLGCDRCGKTYSYTTEEWIEKAKQIHGDKYDYSKVNYINTKTKVCIICPIHGEFWQDPSSHLQGTGCKICAQEKRSKENALSREEFIKRAREIHGDKYDYSKVDYINGNTKVCIICPVHGEFWKTPCKHINAKEGCQKCSNKHRYTTEEWIEKAKQIHGDKYDYSKVKYINCKTKVCIICPIHGEFWQTPSKHLYSYGCGLCAESHLEKDLRIFLEKNNIQYEYQKRFKWLGLQSLDFYIPQYNLAIECQGIQHFEAVDRFGGKEGLEEIQERDERKLKLCKLNKIDVLYYSNLNIKYPYEVIEDKMLLLEKIKKQNF